MQFVIRCKDFDLTGGIRAHTERRLGFALDRFAARIERAEVYLGDVNGPRGGADKVCRILVVCPLAAAVVEEADSDLYRAIDRAARRAAEKVAREMGRGKRPGRAAHAAYRGAA